MKRYILLLVYVFGSLLSSSAWSLSQSGPRIEVSWGQLQFSPSGDLLNANLCFPGCVNSHREITSKLQLFGQSLSSPKALISINTNEIMALARSEDEAQVELLFSSVDGRQSIEWRISKTENLLILKVAGVEAPLAVDSGLAAVDDVYGVAAALEVSKYPFFTDSGVSMLALDASPQDIPASYRGAGFRNRFWTMVFFTTSKITVRTGEDVKRPQLQIQLSENTPLKIYLGPVEPGYMDRVDPELRQMLFAGLWFWLRWIAFGLYALLAWLHGIIPSWGLAIIALSVSVKVLMTPLHRLADRWQHQVEALEASMAPALRRIKKDYKGEAQANKILALHKANGVGMFYKLKSLLGVAILVPVFIGAFDMLAANIHLANEGFLWIKNLSRTDALASLPLTIPFFGSQFNVLPFLMTGLSIWSSLLHNPVALDAQAKASQRRKLLLMAVLFFALFYTFPAGMVLYWTTNNLISVMRDVGKKYYK